MYQITKRLPEGFPIFQPTRYYWNQSESNTSMDDYIMAAVLPLKMLCC